MLGMLLLWYKPFRTYCIKRYLQYVEEKNNEFYSPSAFLCHFNYDNWISALFIPCWTLIKEIKKNKNSKYINNIKCNNKPQFYSNINRIKFLEECLKL